MNIFDIVSSLKDGKAKLFSLNAQSLSSFNQKNKKRDKFLNKLYSHNEFILFIAKTENTVLYSAHFKKARILYFKAMSVKCTYT